MLEVEDKRSVILSHEELFSLRESLKNKKVDFNTSEYAFIGVVGACVSDGGNWVISITITNPKFHKRFTADPWEIWRDNYLKVCLCESRIQKIKNVKEIYIAFMNVNNMTIHMRE
jgi:hypothetical protein